jgi:hypothetical protein
MGEERAAARIRALVEEEDALIRLESESGIPDAHGRLAAVEAELERLHRVPGDRGETENPTS